MNKEAKARDEWFNSTEGSSCLSGITSGKYLRNRLERAFIAGFDAAIKEAGMKCVNCGCTDNDCRQCIEAQGRPCHWVSPGKCSRCFDKNGRLKKAVNDAN